VHRSAEEGYWATTPQRSGLTYPTNISFSEKITPFPGLRSLCRLERIRASAERHELWVIINNLRKEAVQNAQARGEIPENLHFVYHGPSHDDFDKSFLPRFESNMFVRRMRSWQNYLNWNRGLLELSAGLHAKVGF
jgi:hypothetical protein